MDFVHVYDLASFFVEGICEIYQAVESLDEVLDSLVIDLELLGRESFMPLFVVLREGAVLDDDLRQRIRQKIRADISPRHVSAAGDCAGSVANRAVVRPAPWPP